MTRRFLLLLCMLAAAGCSAVPSVGDGVRLVHRYDRPIEEAKTPHGFVVTPQEVWATLPQEKLGRNLYADDEFYYISNTAKKLTSKTGDNSALAKRDGVRISGKNREDIESRPIRASAPAQERCSMGFAELFQLAKGREWTQDEVQAFQALNQEGKNRAVKQLAAEAGCIRTEDQVGTDGVIYTAFWKE